MKLRTLTFVLGLTTISLSALAQDINVAVAANFTAPIKELAPIYEKISGDKLVLSFGSTGAFYAQIKNGAPFDVLLAADNETPAKAIKEGYAVDRTSFTYAVGKLVLWSADANFVKDASVLRTEAVKHVAIANPKLAPYGLAAYEVLNSLKLTDSVKPKVVQGDNIGKTFQFVKTGNAQVGFVALSQCYKNGVFTSGSGWLVPENLYSRIEQDAVLLKKGADNEAAKKFLLFLKDSKEAAKIREAYGYGNAQ